MTLQSILAYVVVRGVHHLPELVALGPLQLLLVWFRQLTGCHLFNSILILKPSAPRYNGRCIQ